jgi:sacsin
LICSTEYSAISKTKSYAISRLHCIPIITDVDFFDASNETDRELFKVLGYQILSTEKLVNDFVTPNLDSQPPWLIDALIELIFEEVSFSGRADVIQLLKSRPFVIVSDGKGNMSTPPKRMKPCKVIAKHSEISGLYFVDEEVFAAGKYSSGVHRQNLILLGMKTRFDADIAGDRIKCFHSRKDEHGIIGMSRDLLSFLNNSEGSFDLNPEWLSVIQIPAMKNDKRMLLAPSECRPKSFVPVVEGVLGIVPLQLEPFLWKFFGWNNTLEPRILSSRINIISSMTSSSDAQLALLPVLKYIDRRAFETTLDVDKYISVVKSELSARPWLPGSIDGLWPTGRVFFRNARVFEPYLTELPTMWTHKYAKILSYFGVQKEPTCNDMLDFIASLDTREPLSASNLTAVIIALERVDLEFSAALLPKIRIPDTQGYLLDVDEFNEAALATDKNFARYAHGKVPSSLTFNCGIPQYEEDLAQIRQIQAEGVFEDYVQEENMITRIAKQVQESTLWLSFNEFVANAEDCGTATEVHWILDPETCRYPTKQLFCPELKVWQSPGLYVHNDGVFTDKDFKALINVGMGSKSGDSTKIGKYGLGALTMYLFTDVPCIISGEYFVIFDPSRKFLPIDRAQRRRKAGLRIRLSQMKELFPDHLVPFAGIGGYNVGKFL